MGLAIHELIRALSTVDYAIPDPGNAAAIPAAQWGICNVVTAGAETRTLAAPTRSGLVLMLNGLTLVGTCTITVASAIDATGRTTISLATAGDFCLLESRKFGSVYRWVVLTQSPGPSDWGAATPTATELNLLSGLLATAAEINRMAQLSTRVVSLTASATISAAVHSDKMLVLNAAGGLTVTLPAPTGSGARFPFSIGTALTAAAYIISSTGANVFGGVFQNNDTSQGTGSQCPFIPNASGSTTITLNGSTQGGRKGDYVVIEDRLAAGYQIMASALNASGTEATPFS